MVTDVNRGLDSIKIKCYQLHYISPGYYDENSSFWLDDSIFPNHGNEDDDIAYEEFELIQPQYPFAPLTFPPASFF